MRFALVALAAIAAVGFAYAAANDEQDARVEFDTIMSDVPLLPTVRNALEGEHQANDLGHVILLVIEKECGQSI